MADTNLQIKNGAGSTVYIKELGEGTDMDPNRPVVAIDQTVSGTTNAVVVIGSLPAGSNSIGKLGSNSGVDIGDVDVLSLPALPVGDNNIGNVDVLTIPSIPAGTNNIGDVDIASIAAGDNNIGNVDIVSLPSLPAGSAIIGKVGIDQTTEGSTNRVTAGGGISVSQTPTITGGAYSAKDAVGGLLTFADAVRISGGKAVINSLTIIDKSQAAAVLELWLFDRSFTATADNAPFDPSDADLAYCIGVIPIASTDYYSANDNEVASVRGVGLQFTSNATSIYGQLKCTGTPTFASTSDLTVVLSIQYLD